MENFNPKVSIIIPVYNGANYLREAIDSALVQTYQNTEIIVVNDGSKDDGQTEAIAVSYGDRIRYFSKPNGGVATALNKGIEEMTGEYFSWLSHDDMYFPEKIERQVRHLAELPDKTTVLYSDFVIHFESTKGRHEVNVPSLHNDYSTDILLQLFSSCINGCTLLIHRDVFKKIGKMSESLRTTQDYEYWFKIFNAGFKFAHVKECLVISRHHSEQDTQKISDVHIKELNDLYVWAFDLLRDKYFMSMDETDLNAFIEIEKTRKLDRPYKMIRALRDRLSLERLQDKPIIWMYWEQPDTSHNAHYIDLCYETVLIHCSQDFNIIRLGPEDVAYYLPDINKDYLMFEKIAHRADYIRYNLLYRYGGIWLDSDTIVLRSMADLVDSINQYGFVFTGYRENDSVFPLIAFLGARKNNEVLKQVLIQIEQGVFPKLKNGLQPKWDEIGGGLISKCINGSSHFMVDLPLFSPVEVHNDNVRKLFHDIKPNEALYKQAYAQFLPNSLIGQFLSFMEDDIFLTSTLLARLLKRGLGRERYLWLEAKHKVTNALKDYPAIFNVARKIYVGLRGVKKSL